MSRMPAPVSQDRTTRCPSRSLNDRQADSAAELLIPGRPELSGLPVSDQASGLDADRRALSEPRMDMTDKTFASQHVDADRRRVDVANDAGLFGCC